MDNSIIKVAASFYGESEFIEESECISPARFIGVADKKGLNPWEVDSNELLMGIEVEMEHTDDPAIALDIAMDHLAELPDYYTRLAKMESGK